MTMTVWMFPADTREGLVATFQYLIDAGIVWTMPAPFPNWAERLLASGECVRNKYILP
jgi:hypothetical protein